MSGVDGHVLGYLVLVQVQPAQRVLQLEAACGAVVGHRRRFRVPFGGNGLGALGPPLPNPPRLRAVYRGLGDHAIDWDLIEKHWTDLLRTGISIREGRLSSVTLLWRLGNHSHKNRLYKAFRELGRVVRTITLLRFLSEPELRQQITAITNRVEAFHGFTAWLMFGGKIIGHNDPDHQERVVKFNELVANCAIYSTALDITDAANTIAAEGLPVDPDDLATITPYITRTIRRFGDWVLNLTPPDGEPVTRLDLEPRALFPTGTG